MNTSRAIKNSLFNRGSPLRTPNSSILKNTMSKLNLSSLKLEPIHFEEHKQGCSLTSKQILQLYEAKCKDLDLKASQQNLDKFAKFCYKFCYTGRLCFQNCGFGAQSAIVINKLLSENERICRLDLSLNNLEDEGCIILSKALSQSTSLVSINLASNEIKSHGAQYLLKSLASNNSIVEIILSSIGIEAK